MPWLILATVIPVVPGMCLVFAILDRHDDTEELDIIIDW
jgi:hypothetical protein